MASIDITCPECKKQLKGPEELIGKKIRCKSCKATFTVKSAKAAAGKAAKAAKAEASGAYALEDEDSKNPYKMTDVITSSRCPQCAADMEEGDIICLNCGYNTQTRYRVQTVKTYETTVVDRALWLTPGILCLLLILVLIGVIVWMWVPAGLVKLAGGPDPDKIAWWGHFSLRIYGSVFAAAIGWWAGKFAFKRLILHYTPPEKLKR
ncbi:MAG TPA: hypothetical protein VGY58_06165 [Gemmataceae bacterium]|nr:hypothetical protein [Gemmataceae bacterium]